MISLPQAAKLLGRNVSGVRKLCSQGRIPGAVKVGRNWILPNKPIVPPKRR